MTISELKAYGDKPDAFHSSVVVVPLELALATIEEETKVLLTVREVLKRECEALKAERDAAIAANKDCLAWFEEVKAERDALREALLARIAELEADAKRQGNMMRSLRNRLVGAIAETSPGSYEERIATAEHRVKQFEEAFEFAMASKESGDA